MHFVEILSLFQTLAIPSSQMFAWTLDPASNWTHWATLRCHPCLSRAATSASSQVNPIFSGLCWLHSSPIRSWLNLAGRTSFIWLQLPFGFHWSLSHGCPCSSPPHASITISLVSWCCPTSPISSAWPGKCKILTVTNLYCIKGALAFVCFSFFFWLRVPDKAEYSAFESTLNSSIVSYRMSSCGFWCKRSFFIRASCKDTVKPVLQEWTAWPLGGTAAAAPPPFRPGNPAICGSHPLGTPYYCVDWGLVVLILCILLSVHMCILLFSLFDLSFVASPSVLWYCWLGLLTCKKPFPI